MSSGTSGVDKRGGILPAIETSLEIARASVAGLGIIGLEAAIGGVLSVVTALKNMRGNEENLRSFQDSIRRFQDTIAYIRKVASRANQDGVPPDLEERIALFVKDLDAMTTRSKVPLRAGIGHKFLMHKEYGSVVNQLNADIHRAIQEFMLKGGAATEAAVEETLQTVQAGFSATRSDIKTAHTELSNEIAAVSEGVYRTQLGVQELHQHSRTWSDHVAARIDAGFAGVSNDVQPLESVALNQHLLLLPRAEARYDSRSRQDANGCLEGTRTKVLKEIYDWINSTDPKSPSILWLCGLAGIGKSTIAHTIAEETEADCRLGASFFFSRDEAGRRNPQLVYPTIATQLARLDHDLKKLIASAVERDHEVGKLVMKKQFEKLISEPLTAWRGAKGTIVIVMDALDECSPESGAEEILVRWAAELPKMEVPLKILITSRPEFHIRRKFQSLTLRSISRPYILHDIEQSVVKEDIELFLRQGLNQVADEHGIQTPWPSDAVLRKLIDRTGILFIFASTAVKFVQNGNRGDPETRLELLLREGASKAGSQYREVDTLYTQVLRYALSVIAGDDEGEDGEAMRIAFRIVVGAIVLLQDPLSSRGVASLLSLDSGDTRKILLHLHSILIVPESMDGEIRLLHPSFRDFLTHAERCPDPRLHVAPGEGHARLAEECLNTLLKELKRDPCHIGHYWLDNDEIPCLSDRLQEAIPSHLRYACRHFVFHLSQASSNHETLANLVIKFCNCRLLAWVETLSLLSEVDNGIMSLRGLQDWYKSIKNPRHETLELLDDANRMILEFGRGIRRSSGHIYISALPFSPPCRLKQQYGQDLPVDYIIRGLPTCWKPSYCTIELPADVQCITYSPDGSLIAAGTIAGGVYVFNSLTGAEVIAFPECDKTVVSVVFAPDGVRLAFTAGNDAVVCDVTTGARLVTLEGHTAEIKSVAFASDGIKALTGSEDSTLGVWNSYNGHLISRRHSDTLGKDDSSCSVALSPDTETIARAIGDSVEIWDWETDHPVRILPDSLASPDDTVHFLPGNVQLVVFSCVFDRLHIWDYQVGALLKSFVFYGDIYVSPFGHHIAQHHSPSGAVTIWDTKTWFVVGELIQGGEFFEEKLMKYAPPFAFSPNGCMLAYSPSTTHIEVWELRGMLKPSNPSDPLEPCDSSYLLEPSDSSAPLEPSNSPTPLEPSDAWDLLEPRDSSDRLEPSDLSYPLNGDGIILSAIAVSADGSRAVCGILSPPNDELPSYNTLFKVWDLSDASPPKTKTYDVELRSLTCSPDGAWFLSVDARICQGTHHVTLWESHSLQDLNTWHVQDYTQSCFSRNGALLAVTAGFHDHGMAIFLLCTASRDLLAVFSEIPSVPLNHTEVELAFLDEDTHIICATFPICRIWDIKAASCLCSFDVTMIDTAIILPYPCDSEEEHTMMFTTGDVDDTRIIVRVSEHIMVESVTADPSVICKVVDGQLTCLEVRNDTLWEFDRSMERPLCWLPTLWRRAYYEGDIIWSGPFLVFGLQGLGGEIGVLDIDSLRRDCSTIKRPRVA